MFESRISAGVTQIQGVRLALDHLNFEPFSLCFRHPDSIFPGNSRMKWER